MVRNDPFRGTSPYPLRHRACFFGGLKSGMILADIFPKNTNVAGVQIGNSQCQTVQHLRFCWISSPICGSQNVGCFFCARFLRFPRLKAFPFDQQSLQVVVASEKLMADEMVRSPEKPNGWGVLDVNNGNLGGVSMAKIQVCNVQLFRHPQVV